MCIKCVLNFIHCKRVQANLRHFEARRNRRPPKYGNINKGFTEDELTAFLAKIENRAAKLAFTLQAFLGLRIGEVAVLKLDQFDINKRKVLIQTEKSGTADELYLHTPAYIALLEFLDREFLEIKRNGGFLFHNGHGSHLSPDYLRKLLREAVKAAGLDLIYGEAEPAMHPRSGKVMRRKLHRLTSHSLRHYYITRVYGATKDLAATSRSARHGKFASTQRYIHTGEEEVKKALQQAFGS